jgi:glucose/mannose-6-phosphate isomerase
MEQMIGAFPAQLEEGLGIAQGIQLRKHHTAFRNVYISGLGGSGIGGNFVQDFTRQTGKLPLTVGKGYQVPAWVGKHTLAICSSYSGNTEETLEAYAGLQATGAKVVCVSSGGKLLERARADGSDVVALPGGWSSPRACLGYSVTAQLGVLRAARLIPQVHIKHIRSSIRLLKKEAGPIREKAARLAAFLYDRTPVVYAPDHMESVAIRWRQQINENAKMLCWHHVIPEMNHNELVGWRDQRPDVAVLWLRNRNDYPRTAVRTDINKEMVEHFTGTSVEVWSKGLSLPEQAFYLVHFGDWLSLELALRRGVDPVEIKAIDYLKQALSNI